MAKDLKSNFRKDFICFFFVSMAAIYGCEKEATSTECGCNSQALENVNTKGHLGFDTSQETPVLSVTSPDAMMTKFYYVCNPEKVNGLYSKDQSSAVEVYFSGQVKKLCKPKVDIPERMYASITIEQIIVSK
ncbi:MAG TPA: hypothetical protein VEV16_10570 [Daejeonella sp.]|nr:hypothetical protein [Daejeonella sp.]